MSLTPDPSYEPLRAIPPWTPDEDLSVWNVVGQDRTVVRRAGGTELDEDIVAVLIPKPVTTIEALGATVPGEQAHERGPFPKTELP
jgi:hypothetical protein